MASEIEILKVLKILEDVYPNYCLSSSAVEVYVKLLVDIPGDLLEHAALEHISRSTFFPTIAELRTAAFDIIDTVNIIPTDYEAWAVVQAEIRRVGYAGQPDFIHILVAKAVEMLGWRYLCLSENPVADRAHFVQAYQGLRENARRDARRLQRVQRYIAARQASNQPQLASGQPALE